MDPKKEKRLRFPLVQPRPTSLDRSTDTPDRQRARRLSHWQSRPRLHTSFLALVVVRLLVLELQ
jgi:hypothetical protein